MLPCVFSICLEFLLWPLYMQINHWVIWKKNSHLFQVSREQAQNILDSITQKKTASSFTVCSHVRPAVTGKRLHSVTVVSQPCLYIQWAVAWWAVKTNTFLGSCNRCVQLLVANTGSLCVFIRRLRLSGRRRLFDPSAVPPLAALRVCMNITFTNPQHFILNAPTLESLF